MKNIIISTLIIYILSTIPGWAVEGNAKLTLCVLLVTMLALALSELDHINRNILRGLRYAILEQRKSKSIF